MAKFHGLLISVIVYHQFVKACVISTNDYACSLFYDAILFLCFRCSQCSNHYHWRTIQRESRTYLTWSSTTQGNL